MAIELHVECSYHQNDDEPREETIPLETLDMKTAKQVKRFLEKNGWVVQFNGDNMDTYCSKKCAE